MAPGLKTLAGAREIRASILAGFERAEAVHEIARQQALTTTVIVGAGPTGVELAGAVAELARHALVRDFRNIDPASARIILIEAGRRLLSAFPPHLGDYARDRLSRLGVTVLTDTQVDDVRGDGVLADGSFIAANTVIWCAGIRASAGAHWINAERDRLGRILVNEDLSVRGVPKVYCIGDLALLLQDGRALPALAQVAKQQGEHLGRSLGEMLERRSPLPPFRFRDRGNAAIVGRSAAVFDFGTRQLTGWIAWVLWSVVHIYLLAGFQKRLLVAMEWLWRWLTYEHGARIIPDPPVCDPASPDQAAGPSNNDRG